MLADALWIVIPIGACAGMLWLAARIEPHWASRDGRRFLTVAQPIDRHGQSLGRPFEVRVTVGADRMLHLARRRLVRRQTNQIFAVAGASEHPPRGKAIYLLHTVPADTEGNQLVLRLPARSKAVAVIDDLIDR